MTRLDTSLPLVRGSFPVRYLVAFFPPWHLPVAALEASRLAVESACGDHEEMAVLGQILAGSLLESDFRHLAVSRPAIKSGRFEAKSWPGAFWSQILAIWRFQAGKSKRLLGSLGNSRFRPNPGRQPLGARFWQFGGFQAGK